MVSTGSYVLSASLLVVLVLALGFSAIGLRRLLMPEWEGAPARLVEAIVGVALLIWSSELLGVVNLLYAGTLVALAIVVAAAVALGPRVLSRGGGGGAKSVTGPAGPGAASLVAVAVVALVFAHWGLTAKDALDRGIFNFDSLWYHMPFAVEMAHSHSVTGLVYPETVYVNWAFPQNSELLHAVGILVTGRDTLSIFLNFAWLGLAFLAAWCIGRPYGRGPLTVAAAGVLLECHTLVVREPGAGKNDLMAAALLLAAIAVLVNADRRPGWPLAAAGLAAGMAVGTKSTALAMAAVLTLAVIVLAPRGRRLAAAVWWFGAALAGGGYWYLRNLVVAGNPVPQLESIGPISLPHPERLQSARPDFSLVHYATDTGIWREYFGPGLHQAFGALWPLVVVAAVTGGLTALLWGRPRVMRWVGTATLIGLLAYAFTPFSAAGADGEPVGFAINIRYALPALLAGLTLLPVALARFWSTASPAGGVGGGGLGGAASRFSPQPGPRMVGKSAGEKPSPSQGPPSRDRTRGPGAWSLWDWCLLGGLLVLMLATNRSDAALRDPDRMFGWLIALLVVLIPAALLFARRRGAPRTAVIAGFAALGLAVLAIGYPVQRDYLRDRFANSDAETSIPGMHLDSAYRWARGVHGARIGLAGTTAGFLEYGLYGTDLSNRVRYLGEKGPHGAFNAIPTCAGFRTAVNEADLDYLVTAPFLDFIEPGRPVASPEARWLRGEPALAPILRSGPVTVWRVQGSLAPAACGPANVPLREIPNQPAS